jgi:L,D-transpeptidase ErfK/SrfK
MRWHSRGGRSLFFPKTVTPSRVVDPSATSVSHPTVFDSRTLPTPVKGARPWLSSAPVRTALVLLLVTANTALAHSATPRIYDLVAGDEQEYRVVRGDTLWSITGRFTMNRALFERWNGLGDPNLLRPGMRLRVSDRHIVPRRRADGIVIDVAVRTLYWFRAGRLEARFPVGVGRTDWETPPGRYRIVGRREDPVWHVPPSIQAEMRARGEKPIAVVPPGPDNPLGKYWIQLSAPGYGLHGTNAPGSIGKYTSHGCMRLLPEHVERLYRDAPDGTPVDVVYEPVKIARDDRGAVYLEVHRDVLGRYGSDASTVMALLAAARLTDAVDAARVADVVERAWGIPEEVGRHAEAAPVEAPILQPASSR